MLTVSATCLPNLESDSKYRASYLDLLMKINDGKVVTSLYDKRDGFNFKILKFPDLRGNVPSRRFYKTKAKRLLKSGQNGPSIALRNDAGELVTQPGEVVEAFADHYERLGKSSTDALFDQKHFERTPPQPHVPALDGLDSPFLRRRYSGPSSA